MNMKHFNYPADFLIEEDGITVTFPDIPECISCGTTIEEAIFHAKDALETVLFEIYIDDNKVLPTPSKPHENQYVIALSMQSSLKLHLYTAMQEKKVNIAYIANGIGLPWNNVKRLLSRKYNAKMQKYEDALKILGTTPVIYSNADTII